MILEIPVSVCRRPCTMIPCIGIATMNHKRAWTRRRRVQPTMGSRTKRKAGTANGDGNEMLRHVWSGDPSSVVVVAHQFQKHVPEPDGACRMSLGSANIGSGTEDSRFNRRRRASLQSGGWWPAHRDGGVLGDDNASMRLRYGRNDEFTMVVDDSFKQVFIKAAPSEFDLIYDIISI